MLNQLLRFAGVGVFGTAGHYVILLIVDEMLTGEPVVGSTHRINRGAVPNY